MAVTAVEIRSGTYYDSIVLMQLQRALADLADPARGADSVDDQCVRHERPRRSPAKPLVVPLDHVTLPSGRNRGIQRASGRRIVGAPLR